MKNEERKKEIGFVATMITNILIECNICLVAKKLKDGRLAVVFHDNQDGKEYAILKE